MATTPEDIQRQIDEMQRKLLELQTQKEELSKPITATLHDILFTGMGTLFQVKLSRFDDKIVDAFRFIPQRNYLHARELNQWPIEKLDQVIYVLKEHIIDLLISEEQQKKIDEWKSAPDFVVSLDDKKKQIRIDKTVRQKTLPQLYELGTWTYHPSGNYWTLATNELLKFLEIVGRWGRTYNFEYTEEVKKLIYEQEERDKLLDQFAEMKDAPDIDFSFKWKDKNEIEHSYELKEDQRVACKFDDTFNHRTLLSYDMGKGKTAIAIAQAERHNERVLFICKADLKTNIKREVYKFTGKEALVFAGIEPDGLSIDLILGDKKRQYNILNYDVIGRETKDKNDPDNSLMKWVEVINLAGFDRIIYDEAHYMKNMETLRSRGGRAIKAPKVMLLTGTPIVNRPGEIFPILNIIDPVTFYDYPAFIRQFTTDGFKPKNLPQLHKLLKKYMIRRLRDKSTDPVRIPQYHTLSQEARKNYADVFNGLYRSLRNPDHEVSVNNILTELLRCKQICADDKVDFTVDLAETALDETVDLPWNKVLIYSQFKATQAEIAVRLGPKCRVINGDVTDRARYDVVDMFMDVMKSDPKIKVIVTNITEGLTLTQAGTVIINDLSWTPKDHAQFEGRAFGRTNDPHGGNAYYVLAEDSIDEMIWSLLEKKMNMIKQIVDDVYDSHVESDSLFSELVKQLKMGM